MSNLTGMDIAAVKTLSAQMKTRANEIRTLANQLTTQLQNTAWVGADQQRFLGDWNGRYRNALTSVANGLDEASTRAMQNANEQEQASR